MTEYDYSPEAYERYLATQNRIAKWVDETEQHRAQFQPAVGVSQQQPHRIHKDPSRHRKPSLYIHPPQQSDSGSSVSDEAVPVSAPGVMYPAQPQPHYPAPPVAIPQPMLSPPPMMQMVYPNTQRPPYHNYAPNHHHHHRSPSHSHSHSIRSPHHTPKYYSMGPSPHVSPAYPRPQQFVYPPSTANPHPPLGYLVMHPPKPPHQPVVYLRA